MKQLAQFLQRIVGQLGLEGPLEDQRIVELWPEVVGEKIAEVSEAEAVRDGVLYVRVANAVWRNELSLEKDRILALFRERGNCERLKDIRFI